MLKKKLIAVFGLLMIRAGGLLQIMGFNNLAGISTLGLAAVVYLILREQLVLVKHQRRITTDLSTAIQGLADVRSVIRWYGKQLLDYGHSTLRRVKDKEGQIDVSTEASSTVRPFDQQAGPLNKIRPSKTNDSAQQKKSPPSKTPEATLLRAGRAATPDVTNPNASETLDKVLSPKGNLVVGGIYDPNMLGTDGIKSQAWQPGMILAILEDHRPDMVVVDETLLNKGKWHGIFSASGTTQMSELLKGISWCTKQHVPVYLLLDGASPEVNSHILRGTQAIQMPLDDSMLREANGAALGPVLSSIQEIALTRKAQ